MLFDHVACYNSLKCWYSLGFYITLLGTVGGGPESVARKFAPGGPRAVGGVWDPESVVRTLAPVATPKKSCSGSFAVRVCLFIMLKGQV